MSDEAMLIIEKFEEDLRSSSSQVNSILAKSLDVLVPELDKISNKIVKELGSSKEILVGLTSEPSLLALSVYLRLRSHVNVLIDMLSLSKEEDSAPLCRLTIVELETRVLLLRSHLFRIIDEYSSQESEYLNLVAEKGLSVLIPELAGLYSKLLLHAGREADDKFKEEVKKQISSIQALSYDVASHLGEKSVDKELAEKIGIAL